MKIALLVLIAAASVLQLPSAVPLSWTVETSRAQPATFEAYQGETIDFEAALQSRGKPLEAPVNYSFFWQTNGMGSTYWEAPARPVPASSLAGASTNVLFATWLPAYDVGAHVYNCFIGSPSNIYHAAFQLLLRPSPGATPNTLPLPTPVIDFARVRVLNPPWSGGGGGVDTNAVIDIANATIETNVLVVATTNRVTALETATNNLTSSVSGLQSSKADKSTTYTKSDTDAKLAGKLDNSDVVVLGVQTPHEGQAAEATSTQSWLLGLDYLIGEKPDYADLNAKADQSEVDTIQEVLGYTYEMASGASSWVSETGEYKADRAEPGDDGELATLDADGNPTRSGIAKTNVATKDDLEDYLPLTGGELSGGIYARQSIVSDTIIAAPTVDAVSIRLGSESYYLHNENNCLADDNGKFAHETMISATDPIFSNAVLTVTTNTIRREVSAALNTYVDGETGVEYEGKFYGGSLYYVPTGNVYPPNN